MKHDWLVGPSLNEDLNRNARGWCDSNTKLLNGFSFLTGGTMAADDVAVVEDCIVGLDEGPPPPPPDSPDLQLQLPL